MVGPDHSLAIIVVGRPLGRVGQRLLLRVVLLAPNQVIVRLNLGPRTALGEVRYRLKIKGTTNIAFFNREGTPITESIHGFNGTRCGAAPRQKQEERLFERTPDHPVGVLALAVSSQTAPRSCGLVGKST